MATRIRLPSQRPNRVGPAPTQGGPATTGSVQVRNVPHQDNPSVYENRVSPTGQAANYVSNGPNDTQLSNHGPSLSVGSGGSIGIEGRAAAAGVGGAAMGAGGHEPLYDFRAAVVQPANFNGGGGVGPSGFNYAASPSSPEVMAVMVAVDAMVEMALLVQIPMPCHQSQQLRLLKITMHRSCPMLTLSAPSPN